MLPGHITRTVSHASPCGIMHKARHNLYWENSNGRAPNVLCLEAAFSQIFTREWGGCVLDNEDCVGRPIAVSERKHCTTCTNSKQVTGMIQQQCFGGDGSGGSWHCSQRQTVHWNTVFNQWHHSTNCYQLHDYSHHNQCSTLQTHTDLGKYRFVCHRSYNKWHTVLLAH